MGTNSIQPESQGKIYTGLMSWDRTQSSPNHFFIPLYRLRQSMLTLVAAAEVRLDEEQKNLAELRLAGVLSGLMVPDSICGLSCVNIYIYIE